MALPTLTKADTLDRWALRSLGRTPFAVTYDEDGEHRGDSVPCPGCGVPIATEADMARHFVVPDGRYLNLGECPVASAARTLGVPCPVRPSRDPMVSLVKHTYDDSVSFEEARYRYPEHTEDCAGCANDGYALRDRATALWFTRAVSIMDVAYTGTHGAMEAPERTADRHVTVYEIDRAYGGPEEGGWYFDTGSVEWTYQAGSHAAADVIARTLCAVLWPVDSGDSGSVNYSGGEYSVCVDDTPGADYPAELPHYS